MSDLPEGNPGNGIFMDYPGNCCLIPSPPQSMRILYNQADPTQLGLLSGDALWCDGAGDNRWLT